MAKADTDAEPDAVASLYRTPPEKFVAARDERVKELRGKGATEAAAQVAKLRRPTLAAWLVNLLVADAPELPAQFGELAGQLREAQDQLAGDELRALGQQRHRLVAALVTRARKLARASGRAVAADALGEVESTLRAALADSDVAVRVLSGQLTHTESIEGFGQAASTTDRPKAKPAEKRPAAAKTRSGATNHDSEAPLSTAQLRSQERRRATELAKAERKLDKAEGALQEAEEKREVAERNADEAKELADAAEQRAAWLRTQLQQAEAELADAQKAAEDAARRASAAEEGVARARDRVAAAQARADLI